MLQIFGARETVTGRKILFVDEVLRLNNLLEAIDSKLWSGFYATQEGFLGGYTVGCDVVRGVGQFGFTGMYGSPREFAAILSEINAIFGEDCFPNDWHYYEKRFSRFENMESFHEQMESMIEYQEWE